MCHVLFHHTDDQIQYGFSALCFQVHPSDSEEAVRHRMSQWNAYCEELEDMYPDAQRVNADQDPHTVFECIESMLVNQLPKRFPNSL